MRGIDWYNPFDRSMRAGGAIDGFVPHYRNCGSFWFVDNEPKTTIKIPCEKIDRPIRRAESTGTIHLAVACVVVEKSMDLCPILGIADCFDLPTISPKLQLEFRESGWIDLFDAPNRLMQSDWP